MLAIWMCMMVEVLASVQQFLYVHVCEQNPDLCIQSNKSLDWTCTLYGIPEWYRPMYHVHQSSLYEFDSHLSVSQFNDSAKYI